jgi:hypothetical protein
LTELGACGGPRHTPDLWRNKDIDPVKPCGPYKILKSAVHPS